MNNREREVFKVEPRDAREIVSGDDERFKLIQEEIDGTSRWTVDYSVIVQRISDGKYFSSCYSCGATEMQEQLPYDNDEPEFTEVFKEEKVIEVFV